MCYLLLSIDHIKILTIHKYKYMKFLDNIEKTNYMLSPSSIYSQHCKF